MDPSHSNLACFRTQTGGGHDDTSCLFTAAASQSAERGRQVGNPPVRKVDAAHVFSWEHRMKDCRIPPCEAQGYQGPHGGPGLSRQRKNPVSPREPGSKAEPGREWPAPASMVARPGLPDKRGAGTLFRLAGRPDSDNDRRALSLTTCLALQIVRLETKPNWKLRGEGRNGFAGAPRPTKTAC